MQEVEDLVRCHDEHPFMKFLNVCDASKMALDKCFRVGLLQCYIQLTAASP